MEPGAIMEGGDWNVFNGVYVNEEADFMARLFSTNISATTSDIALDENSNLACWSDDFNMANPNLYCSFPQDSGYSGGSCITSYPTTSNGGYYVCDNNNSATFVGFLEGKVNSEMEESGEVEHDDDNYLLLMMESDKDSECPPPVPRKRSRASDAPRGKSDASKSKKRRKGDSDNNGGLTRQSSSGCSSEEESNLSLELNNGVSSSSIGKTRASRGSATDPQSLYARKRRERINERLRILQGLVPNGTKVDISTMLEEAVQYVKFLQLQIKLLSSDDLWMYAPLAYNGMDIGLDLKINPSKC